MPAPQVLHPWHTLGERVACLRCNPYPQYVLTASAGEGPQVIDAVVSAGPAAPAAPHTHAESEVTGLANDLTGKAATVHVHDYATTGHGHATYATDSHNHDSAYAPTHAHPYSATAHNHDDAYSGTAHAHDAAYSTVAHTHAAYAVTAHNHDATYATGAHVHDYSASYSTVNHAHAAYATSGHNHDVAYATAAHVHAAVAPVHTNLANDTLALALGTNTSVRLTVTANRTLTTTVPAAGRTCVVLILTSGASTFTVTFGTGFKPTGTLATGATTGRVFALSFISDGTNLYETGRTAAMVA